MEVKFVCLSGVCIDGVDELIIDMNFTFNRAHTNLTRRMPFVLQRGSGDLCLNSDTNLSLNPQQKLI